MTLKDTLEELRRLMAIYDSANIIVDKTPGAATPVSINNETDVWRKHQVFGEYQPSGVQQELHKQQAKVTLESWFKFWTSVLTRAGREATVVDPTVAVWSSGASGVQIKISYVKSVQPPGWAGLFDYVAPVKIMKNVMLNNHWPFYAGWNRTRGLPRFKIVWLNPLLVSAARNTPAFRDYLITLAGPQTCVLVDYRLENLRWDTRSANQLDRIAHGTDNRGEKHYRAKLTEQQVLEIRARYSRGDGSCPQLGAEYGVSRGVIRHIVNRTNWRSV